MPNYKQAPKLYHNKTDYKSNNFYQLPQDLMDSIFQQLDGKCGNQIKLMTVLLGTLGDGSFGVSEKWVCERTGMIQQTYNTARKALVKRGWIYLENGYIFVLPEVIRTMNGATEEQIAQAVEKCVKDLKTRFNIQNKGTI